MHEIEVKMYNILRAITWNKKFSHVSHLYQNVKPFKVKWYLQIGAKKLIHKLYNDNRLIIFQNRFTNIEKIHAFVTRGKISKITYYLKLRYTNFGTCTGTGTRAVDCPYAIS